MTICERKTSDGVSPSGIGGTSNGLMCSCEDKEMLNMLPPNVFARRSYSFSGSITITISMPAMSERKISNLVVYDLPEPDLANTTSFAFYNEKLSKITKLLLCRLMPYMIPWLEERSSETNGKNDEIGPVFIGE